MATLKVVRVVTDADMRRSRALAFERKFMHPLKPGEAILLINRRCDMARFVDQERIIHTCYAKEGEMFDVASITEQLSKRTMCIDLSLQLGKLCHIGRHTNLSTAKERKAKRRKAA